MRTINSAKNIFASLITNSIAIIIGILAQAIFIKILGKEYLGINSLFNNIISFLSVVELGIGTAIVYNLYLPVAKNNKEKINTLMVFYKKCYRIIAFFVLVFGLIIIPFIPKIVGKVNIDESLILIFCLFLLDAIFSYFLSYKKSILYANQKNYIINIVHIIYLFLFNTIQIIYLIKFENYIGYLVIKIIFRILENLVLNKYINNKYNYLKNNGKSLDKKTKNDIIKKVKALFLHKISSFIVMGTDNIIISLYLGIVTVGIYSNYLLIINAISGIFSQTLSSLTASIGNMLIEKQENKNYFIYKCLTMGNFWLYSLGGALIFFLIQPFVILWVGKEFLLSTNVVLMIIINFYIRGMRDVISSFKTAAGIFYEDRFVPIFESIINLIASLLLVKYFGLAGIILATIISTMLLYFYSYPKYVFNPLFHQKKYKFIVINLLYFGIFAFILFLINFIIGLFSISNLYVQLIFNFVICIIISNLIIFLLVRKTKEFKYLFNIIKKIIKNINLRNIKKEIFKL